MTGLRCLLTRRPAWALGAALAVGLVTQACSSRDVTGVSIGSVTVRPTSVTLAVGQTRSFSAEVRDDEGTILPSTTVTWSSSNPSVVSVTPEGLAEALTAGTAMVRATVQGVTGSATVTVEPPPSIVATPATVDLFGQVGGSDGGTEEVAVTNGGAGTLTGLAASVEYEAGGPTGWLSPSLSSTIAPATLTLSAVVGGLQAGTYRATVRLTSPVAENSPVTVAVELEVSEDRPLLRLTPSAVGFAAVSGGGVTPAQTVEVTNVGGGDLTGLDVSVVYQPGGSGWLDASLEGETAPTELELRADPQGLAPGTYLATATVSSPVAVNSPRPVSVSFSVEPEPEADLSVTKIGPDSVVSGDTASFVLVISNAGPREARDVLLVDSLPAEVTLVEISGNGVADGQVVTWLKGTVEAGASTSDTIRVRAGEGLGTWENVARVSSGTLDPDPGDERDAAGFRIVPRPAGLAVTKSGPAVAEFGDTVRYVLVWGNRGPGVARNVTLLDSLPAGAIPLSATGGGVIAGDVVTWSRDSLLVGDTLTDTLSVRIDATGSLTDVARIFSSTNDTMPGDNRSQVTTSVDREADLSITKAGPDTVGVTDTLIYVLTVANAGPDTAASVQMVDSLPAGTSFVSATNGGVAAGRVVTWSPFDVAAGESRTDTVRAVADSAATVENAARASSPTPDSDAADLRSTVTTKVVGADLSLVKSGPATAGVGDTLLYTLSLTNAGADTAMAVAVEDSLPVGAIFVSATGGGALSGSVVTWSYGTVEPGDARVDTLRVVAAVGGDLINVGRAAASTPDPDTVDLRSSVTTDVEAADLAVGKTGPGTAAVGDTVEYVVVVANAGPDDAAGVVVTDSLPSGMSYVSATGAPAVGGGVLTWSKGTLPAGAASVDTITVVAVTAGTSVNVVRASGTTADPDTVDLRATVVTTVTGADVSVTKSAPASVAVGDAIEYVIVTSNAGPDEAAGVTVTDSLPAGVTLVSAPAGFSQTGREVTWSIGTLASGASRSDTVEVTADSVGTQENVVGVASTTSDPDSDDLRGTASTDVTGADVMVTKTGPASAAVGGSLEYVVTTTNAGPDDAADVTVTDSLPAGVTLVSAPTGFSQSGPEVTWSIGTLASGATRVDTVEVTPTTTGTKTNVVRVTSTTADPDVDDLRDTATTDVTGANLSVVKSATATVAVGDPIEYVITTTNAGPDPADNVTVTDSLPVGVTLVSAPSGFGQSGRELTWSIGTLASGATRADTVEVTADSTGVLENVARVSSTTPDPDPGDLRAAATTEVTGADLSVAKTGPASVEVGDTVRYALTVSNAGPDAAAAVELQDTLPAGVTFVSATGGVVPVGGVLTFSKGSLDPGTSTLDSVVVVATATGFVTNVARVSTTTADPDTTDHRAPLVTSVTGADLEVAKTGPASAAVLSTVEYVITTTNAGPDAAADVTVTDSLPAGVTLVSAPAGFSQSGREVTWSIGTLASGATRVDTVEVTPTTIGSKTNIVRVASVTADPDSGDLRDTVATNVTGADLSVTKSATAAVDLGDPIEYVIVTSNGGPDAAADVTVTDTLPAGVTLVSAPAGTAQNGRELIWSVGTLASGASRSDTVDVTADAVGSLENVAWVSSTTPDPDSDDVRDVASTSVSGADLAVVKTGPASAGVGTTVEYVITTTNAGPDAATSVSAMDSIPVGVTLVSAPTGFSQTGRQVTWSIGTLASGASRMDTVEVTPTTLGTKTNIVRVTSATADPDSADLRDTADTDVTGSDLSVAKSGPVSVAVGDTVDYTITTSNAGPDEAGATVADSLPVGVTFVSGPNTATLTGRRLEWSVGPLASGASRMDVVRVVADSTGSLTNIVRITTTAPDPDSADHRDELVTTVSGADVSVAKSATASVAVGGTIEYVVTTTNAGPDDAAGVTVTDSLPANVTLVSAPAGFTQNGPELTWSIGTLASGSPRMDTVVVTADATGTLENVVRVTSTTPDPDTTDLRDTASTSVSSPPPGAGFPAGSPAASASEPPSSEAYRPTARLPTARSGVGKKEHEARDPPVPADDPARPTAGRQPAAGAHRRAPGRTGGA